MTCADTARVTGKRMLFLGVETASWTSAEFAAAADFARAHNVDSLLVKVADGTRVWYGGITGYRAIASLIRSHGVGCIPYTYSYCNKFGGLDGEIDILIAYMRDSGVVCADMEAEWNGCVGEAQHLCQRMLPVPGTFLVSTWADPDMQNWGGVLQALNPCVNAYMPQQYDNYLASCWQQFNANGAACLFPTIDLTGEFGANDPVQIASAAHAQGHAALSIWHYGAATANVDLFSQVLATFPEGGTSPVLNTVYGPGKGDFSQWFTVGSDNNWTCKQTGAVILGDNLKLYTTLSIDGNTLPVIGLPLSGEQSQTDSNGYHWTKQPFERGEVWYDPQHKHDGQPGFTDSYLGKVDHPVSIPADVKADVDAAIKAIEPLA